MMGAMNLSHHIAQKGGTGTIGCPVLAQIAARAGCSAATLYMISKGHKSPSPRLAKAISQATDDAVHPGTMREDVFGPAPAIPQDDSQTPDAEQGGPAVASIPGPTPDTPSADQAAA